MEHYRNRSQAGRILANELKEYTNRADALVLALPRGGVPVAYEIAQALSVPLDVFIVRKLGVPAQKELAMGAMATGGVTIFNEEIINSLNISKQAIERVIQEEQQELKRREIAYRGNRPLPILTNKTVLLVDDGIATGASMLAAIQAVRKQKPAFLILAVPVMALSVYDEIAPLVDKLICPLKPVDLRAVGLWYDDFSQTSDEEVSELLDKTNKRTPLF